MKTKRYLPPSVSVLLVEDDKIDAEALRRAFANLGIENPVHIASDGVTALAMLRGENGRPIGRPCALLIDINMPRMNGVELLREIREDERLRDVVLFVLTSSASDEHMQSAHELDIRGYMLKSEVGKDFVNCAEMLGYYWRDAVRTA